MTLMHFTLIGLVAASCCLAAMAQEPAATSAPADNNVMQYLAQRAVRTGAQLPKLPADKAAWEKRRLEVRGHLTEALGLPDTREPMRAKVLKSQEASDVVIEDVIYLWAGNTYVSANVVRPKDNSRPLPTLVMPPGWVGEMNQAYYKSFLLKMAQSGYLLLFINDPHVLDRKAPCAGLYAVASAAGTQVMGIQVFDTLRGLDYVLTRKDVDPKRIGITGLCQGSEQTWLAAALEDRFQVAAPVCGTTTFVEWCRMPVTVPMDLSDPSPYVTGLLRHTDWDEIDACIAPRPLFIASNSGDNWWPKKGYKQVVATLEEAYKLYGKSENFSNLWVKRSHSMTPFMDELQTWFDKQLKALPASATVTPLPCQEPADIDMSMLSTMQKRIARQSKELPSKFETKEEWLDYRKGMIKWLGQACEVAKTKDGAVRIVSTQTVTGTTTEILDLGQDDGLSLRVTLYYPQGKKALPAAILSHDSLQSIDDPALTALAENLAKDGFVVCVPHHASTFKGSHRLVKNVSSLYGVGDSLDVGPMAMRVWDDLRAMRLLLGRPEVDKGRIALVGLGVGGMDTAIAAALDERVAATASVGVTTLGDWAEKTAPGLDQFDRIMPYLPGMSGRADMQQIYSAIAPRPLLLLDGVDRVDWPASAFDKVRKLTRAVYYIYEASDCLSAKQMQSPCGAAEVRFWINDKLNPAQAK